jgi:hypothetical protein
MDDSLNWNEMVFGLKQLLTSATAAAAHRYHDDMATKFEQLQTELAPLLGEHLRASSRDGKANRAKAFALISSSSAGPRRSIAPVAFLQGVTDA